MKKVIFGLMSILMALSLTLVSCESSSGGSSTPSYTVTFSVPNGWTAPESITAESGSSVELPEVTPLTGFNFVGWATTESATVADVESPYTVVADVTLYAIYTPIEYSIAYKDGGNDYSAPEGTTLVASYTIESDEITLPTPVSNGRTIAWYDNAGFTENAVTKIPTGSTGNKIFYAKWIETAGFDATVENPSDIAVAKDTSDDTKIVLTATAIEGATYTWKCENLALDLTATTGNVCEISYDGLAKGVTYVISVKVEDFYKEVRFTVPNIS